LLQQHGHSRWQLQSSAVGTAQVPLSGKHTTLQNQPGGPARQQACSRIIALMCELCWGSKRSVQCDGITVLTKSTHVSAGCSQTENSKDRIQTLRADCEIYNKTKIRFLHLTFLITTIG